jgi:hypothetical protein
MTYPHLFNVNPYS